MLLETKAGVNIIKLDYCELQLVHNWNRLLIIIACYWYVSLDSRPIKIRILIGLESRLLVCKCCNFAVSIMSV